MHTVKWTLFQETTHKFAWWAVIHTSDLAKPQNCQNWRVSACTEIAACLGQYGTAQIVQRDFVHYFLVCVAEVYLNPKLLSDPLWVVNCSKWPMNLISNQWLQHCDWSWISLQCHRDQQWPTQYSKPLLDTVQLLWSTEPSRISLNAAFSIYSLHC